METWCYWPSDCMKFTAFCSHRLSAGEQWVKLRWPSSNFGDNDVFALFIVISGKVHFEFKCLLIRWELIESDDFQSSKLNWYSLLVCMLLISNDDPAVHAVFCVTHFIDTIFSLNVYPLERSNRLSLLRRVAKIDKFVLETNFLVGFVPWSLWKIFGKPS